MRPIKLLLCAIGSFLLSLGVALSAAYFLQGSTILSASLDWVKSIRAYIFESGSMAPAVGVGSLVITRRQPTYSSTDVVTFATDGNLKNLTTHRIAFKTYPDGPEGQTVYITKGDQNNAVDPSHIKNENIVGRVFLTIPYVGYAAVFLKQPLGFILLVIVPATIIIYEELKNLSREILKLLRKLKRRSMPPHVEFQKIVSPKGFPKVAAFIPAMGAGLLIVSATSSFFFDKQKSTSNVLAAASAFASPQPSPSVKIEEPNASPSPTPAPTPSASPASSPSTVASASPESHHE